MYLRLTPVTVTGQTKPTGEKLRGLLKNDDQKHVENPALDNQDLEFGYPNLLSTDHHWGIVITSYTSADNPR
jgi:hypothetical protein